MHKGPKVGPRCGCAQAQLCWGGGRGGKEGIERRAVRSCQAGERPWMSPRKPEQLFTLKRPNKPAQRAREAGENGVGGSASPLVS